MSLNIRSVTSVLLFGVIVASASSGAIPAASAESQVKIDQVAIGMPQDNVERLQRDKSRSGQHIDGKVWYFQTPGCVVGNPNIGPEVWYSPDGYVSKIQGLPLTIDGITLDCSKSLVDVILVAGQPDEVTEAPRYGARNLVYQNLNLTITVASQPWGEACYIRAALLEAPKGRRAYKHTGAP